MQQGLSTQDLTDFHALAELIIATLEEAGAYTANRKKTLAQVEHDIAAAWHRHTQLDVDERDYARSIEFSRNDAEYLFRDEATARDGTDTGNLARTQYEPVKSSSF